MNRSNDLNKQYVDQYPKFIMKNSDTLVQYLEQSVSPGGLGILE